jgi:hypothetical protein
MANWTHELCLNCYQILQPNRVPARLTGQPFRYTPCCLCGAITSDPILYRMSPDNCHQPNNHEKETTYDSD